MSFEMYISATTIENSAQWHADKACAAYRKRDYKTYRKHIRISEQLRTA